MELKLEHVLLFLLFVFLFKMIMDKCGCRGNNPIEGYANMNECYIDWSKGNIHPNNSACPEGTHALSSDWAEMEDTQPPLIFLNDRGEVRYGWFYDSDLKLIDDASTQINCATGLVEECATNLDDTPGDGRNVGGN